MANPDLFIRWVPNVFGFSGLSLLAPIGENPPWTPAVSLPLHDRAELMNRHHDVRICLRDLFRVGLWLKSFFNGTSRDRTKISFHTTSSVRVIIFTTEERYYSRDLYLGRLITGVVFLVTWVWGEGTEIIWFFFFFFALDRLIYVTTVFWAV